MSVKIRLTRVGKKHEPFFRVVAVDSRKKRDGEFLANIGTYNALESKLIKFDVELYNEWVSKGAIPSDSAKKLFKLSKQASAPVAEEAAVAKPVKKAAPKKAKKEESKKEA
jgi:small subunit ribosomal protein S16